MRPNSVTYVDTLSNVILEQFDIATEIWIAVGLMSESAIKYLERFKGTVNIMVGIDLPTPPIVLRYLLQLSKKAKIRFKVYLNKGNFFHPKLYVIKLNSKLVAYVGSGNFTERGFTTNVELFSIVENQIDCQDLINWFELFYEQALVIDENFILEYEIKTYLPNKNLTKSVVENVTIFKNKYETDYDQFFRQEHFNAFIGDKPFLDTAIAKRERKVVQDRLLELHKKIYPIIIEKGWDLHPNGRKQNITSLYWHSPFNSKELSALWLYYGKGLKELQADKVAYDSDLSPIDHIRLQVIVRAQSIGIWCAVGKDNGSKLDRKAFNQKIQIQEKKILFFDLIKSLNEEYFIDIDGAFTYVKDIKSCKQLYSIANEDIKHLDKYFIIGLDIAPDDFRLRDDQIVDFIIGEFAKLYQLYEFIKAPIIFKG